MTGDYSKYDVGIEHRRALNAEVGDITEGYFPWLQELEVYANHIIQSAKSDQGADRAVAEAIIDAITPLRRMWADIERDGSASPDTVKAVAVLSALLMDFSHFGLILEGKHAIHRRSKGGKVGAETRKQDSSASHAQVHQLRKQGLTQKKIAERVNLSVRQVRKILTGK